MSAVEMPPEVEEALSRLDLAFHVEGRQADYTVPPESKAHQEAEGHPKGHWFACHHPERKHKACQTGYHDCCRACLIAAQAAGFNAVTVMAWRLETFGEADDA